MTQENKKDLAGTIKLLQEQIAGLETVDTKRKKAELKLKLSAQRAEALLKLSQMDSATLKEITDFTLEETVRLTESSLGYLAFLNEDGTVMTMHSWSKAAMKECAIDEKPIIYPVEKTGLWGEAVRQRKPIITNDYAAPNPFKKGYPEGHVHVTRHMNAPVFSGDKMVIVAGVGNKVEPYDDDDVVQLTLMMKGMWRLIERKRAEEEIRKLNTELEQRVEERTVSLRESAERFSTLANNISQLAWMADAQGSIFWYNQRWFDYTGTTLEEMYGWGWQKVHHPDHVQRVVDKIKHCFETGEVWEDTFPLRGTDGQYRWFLSRAVPIRDEHSKVLRWFGTNTDITAHKKLEEEQNKLAAIIESADDAIVGKDLEGIIVSWNKGAENIYGYKAEEIIGKSISLLILPDQPDEYKGVLAKISRGETVMHYETKRRKKDGQGIDVSLTVSPVKDASGKIIGASTIACDITERKRLEEEIMRKTKELTRSEAELDQMKQFSFAATHDLQEPLHKIITFLSLFKSCNLSHLSGQGPYYLECVEKAAESMHQMMERLREMARIPFEEVMLQSVNLEEVIREILAEPEFALHRAEDVVKLGKLPTIKASRLQMHQLFHNLIENAFKFRDAGMPLYLEIGSQTRGQDSLEITVKDKGIGFEEKYAEQIFAPFKRLHTRDKYQGNGMGLAICRGIVKRHGGTLTATSQPAQGATFVISLPFHS